MRGTQTGNASLTKFVRCLRSLDTQTSLVSSNPIKVLYRSASGTASSSKIQVPAEATEAVTNEQTGNNTTAEPPEPHTSGSEPLSAKAEQLKALRTWAAVPSVAKVLGLAGLIPFYALAPPIAAHIPLLPPSLLADAASMQVGYGVAIASFLGGVHWGAAMLDFRPAAKAFEVERYLWGVTPSLLAWPALYMDAGPGAFAAATALGVVHAVDSSFSWRSLVPPWYMSLRRPLTAMAIGGLLITAGDDIISERRQLEERAQAAETSAS